MLALRRGTVLTSDGGERLTRATVRLEDGSERPAVAYPRLTGPVAEGDDVIVNVEAQDLGLGSGGFDIVHANLSRLEGGGSSDAHVMKLNYTSLQHSVEPVEEGLDRLELPLDSPVGILALHGQLACLAFAFAERSNGKRLGYVQSSGAALPGALSDSVAELLERGLLCSHVTAGSCFGGQYEAITVEGAIDAGKRKLGWDAAVVGPGPGVIGSASVLGHGGLAALANASAGLSLGCKVVIAPRVSSGDSRARHRGLSHHSATILEMLPAAVTVAVPADASESLFEQLAGVRDGHTVEQVEVQDLIESYLASGLTRTTMGRDFEDDREFFLFALAAGCVLGEFG